MNLESAGINANKDNILEQYCNISNKLKKRFLRKPNVTEGSDAFTALAQHCETNELKSYAGLCWIAAARCEGSLNNLPGEINCLIRAGRQFLSNEENDSNLNCFSPSKENLQAGLSCFEHASSKFAENSSNLLAINLNMEIIANLKKLNKNQFIEYYLNSSIDLCSTEDDCITRLFCLKLLSNYLIENGDYVGGLDLLTEITTILNQISNNNFDKCNELLQCEINRVFLLLILRITPQKLSPNLAQLLEKYTWGDKNDKSLQACQMPENLFLLLQSLVTICQSLDTSSLINLEGELWVYLTNEQKDLLRILIKIYLP